MINVRDVLYLLDQAGAPLRSVTRKYELSIDHVDDNSSVLTVSVPMTESIQSEQQFIYRGQRYIVSNIETNKVQRRQVITAEIAYMQLAKDLCTFNLSAKSVEELLEEALKNTRWSVGTVAVVDDNHSMSPKDEQILATLRQLANLSELKLTFDTLNFTVSYVESTAGDIGFLFRYRQNIEEITRRENAPQATVVYPKGANELSIASVNDGVSYIEDYSYYTSQGLTLEQARLQFRKVGRFEDERYIYAGNLMRAAEKYLAVASHPQVAYDVSVSLLPEDARIGQYGYVIDDELGMKVNVNIVRMVEYEDRTKNKVELNYLIPGLADSRLGGGSSGGSGGLKTVMAKNQWGFVGSQYYQRLIDVDITNMSSMNAQVFINLRGILSEDAILEAEIELDGVPIEDYKITQVMFAGPQSNDYNFVVTQIQEGSHTIRVMLRTSSGRFTAEPNQITISVQAENLQGGTGSGIPEIDIIDVVTLPAYIETTEFCTITLEEYLAPQATASSYVDPQYPELAFDGNGDTYWSTALNQTTGWLKFDFRAPERINTYSIHEARELDRNARAWTLQGSNDDTNWTTLDSQVDIGPWTTDEVKRFELPSDAEYRYYKLDITESNGNRYFLVVGELALFYETR